MTILDDLKSWKGEIEINGQKFDSIEDANSVDFSSFSDNSSIYLYRKRKNSIQSVFVQSLSDLKTVKITVKRYMTEKAKPSFDFMQNWNNNVPMPLMTMVGTIEKETAGMYYMKLYGDITGEPLNRCLKCGREITNDVSKYFGMGPICGNHNYVNPFDTVTELKAAIENYRRNYLNKITWEGWVIKSAITKMEEYDR